MGNKEDMVIKLLITKVFIKTGPSNHFHHIN